MKCIIFFASIFIFLSSLAQNIGINTNGNAPNISALLDVDASPLNDKGILIPRVSLIETNSSTPIMSPARSLLVYNIATINDVIPGFYYWDGVKWVSINDSNNDNSWSINGNANTSAATNFLGTTTSETLVFKTDNTERVRITSTGEVGINNQNPVAPLSFTNNTGNKISLWGQNTSSQYGFGIQGSLLQIYCAASNNDIAFGYGSSTTFTENMRIKGNGNVGIGTNAPGTKFHIVSNVPSNVPVRIQNTTNSGYAGIHFHDNTNILTGHIGYANLASPTHPGLFYMGSVSAVPAVLTTNDIERIRITPMGDVGIGTSVPNAKLNIVSTNLSTIPLRIQHTVNDGYSDIFFNDDANTQMGHIGYANTGAASLSGLFHLGSLAAIPTVLTTDNTERVRITSTGNVGVGTNNPQSKLEIDGYTKLGTNAPAIKTLKLTGTTDSNPGGQVIIPHGLNSSKIVSVSALVEWNSGQFMPDAFQMYSGYEFYFDVGPATITITNAIGMKSNFILSKPFRIFITYEE